MRTSKVSARYFEYRQPELAAQLGHAVATIDWYAQRWPKLPDAAKLDHQWFRSHIPLLEKRQTGDHLLDPSRDRGQLFRESTSGTEGRPLVCFKSRTEQLRCTVELWRRRQMWIPGLSTVDRFARFYAFRSPDRERLVTNQVLYRNNDILIPLFDLSAERLREYWAQLVAFAPRWMHGPSTAVFNLARFVREHDLPPCGLEFVELNGEFAPAEHIDVISQVFGCKVANNYGSREFWTLGYACPAGRMHVPDRSVLIEQAVGAGESGVDDPGELVVTSLRNRAWPLVRYRLGDVGLLRDTGDCGCGSRDRFSLELTGSRRADYFTLAGDRTYNAIMFSGILRGLSTLSGMPVVYQYQVRKTSANGLEILLCLNPESNLAPGQVVDRYDAELRAVVGAAPSIDYKIVDCIHPDPFTGKVRDFMDATR